MSDGSEWFAPKRYGYGAGRPVSWQGWAITLAFILVVTVLSLAFRNRPAQLCAALAPFVIGFLIICARTTRGGWRWRWGDDG
jgi:hypothetical protein